MCNGSEVYYVSFPTYYMITHILELIFVAMICWSIWYLRIKK